MMALAPAEGAAFLMTESASDGLLVRRVRVFQSDEFDEAERALSIREDVQSNELALIKQSGHSLIDVHTHPHSDRDVAFSTFDLSELAPFARYIKNKMPGRAYGAVVFGRRSYQGLDLTHGSSEPIDLVGIGELSDQPEWQIPDGADGNIDGRFDRQVRALGPDGQSRLTHLRVGVVGLGGTGSLVVQQLAHLGIRNFSLIDDDRVDRTNLPRLAGAAWWDALLRTKKNRVAHRQIKRAGNRATVRRHGALRSAEALTALKQVDIIIGCVDNDGARLVLSELAAAYLIPYLDVGVSIATEREAVEMGGRISFALPGRPCLACADDIDFAEAGEDLESEALRSVRIQRGYASNRAIEPALMPLNATCVSLAVTELLAFATGFRRVRPFIRYSASESRIIVISVDRNTDCPVCVPAQGMGDRHGIDRYARDS